MVYTNNNHGHPYPTKAYYYSPTGFATSPPLTPPTYGMAGNGEQQQIPPPSQNTSASSTAVQQALQIARDSPEGARDPVVSDILETALASIWQRVQEQPHTYVMTRDEFAVFNYFQHRFVGQDLAIAARKRYWDNNNHTRNGR